MPTRQEALTVLTSISEGRTRDLEACLKDIAGPNVSTVLPFARMTGVHYARWVILPAYIDSRGDVHGPTLALSTNFDGALEPHFRRLVAAAPAVFDSVYSYCDGYPEPGDRNDAARIEFLRRHQANGGLAFFVGNPWRTVGQIKKEQRLREVIREFLDRDHGWSSATAGQIRQQVQRFVFEQCGEDFAWASTPPSRQSSFAVCLLDRLWWLAVPILVVAALTFQGFILVAFVLYPAIALLAAAMFSLLVVRAHEIREADTDIHIDSNLASLEDPLALQNPLSHVVPVKSGIIRRTTVSFVVAFVNVLCRCLYTKGTIGGISSIHFARWLLIDGGRRLLFLSNFDGSWKNYLAETSDDQAAAQLSSLWSNTRGFPRSRWLGLVPWGGGTRSVTRFEGWTRANQVPTQVWFCAYQGLSQRNIDRNTAIRRGLSGTLSNTQAEEWLRYL